jgi:hypothetical protein
MEYEDEDVIFKVPTAVPKKIRVLSDVTFCKLVGGNERG